MLPRLAAVNTAAACAQSGGHGAEWRPDGDDASMRITNIGLAEWHLTANPEERLVAIGIGSCVAVLLYDPRRRLGAMAHIMLPNGPLGEPVPAKFANVVVPLMIGEMRQRGAENLRAGIVGGSTMLGNGQSLLLEIGRRNVDAATTALAAAGAELVLTDTGGTRGRTVELGIAEGDVVVKVLGQPDVVYWELAGPLEEPEP